MTCYRPPLTYHSEFTGYTYHLVNGKYVDINIGTNKRIKNRVTVTAKSHPHLNPKAK